MRLAIAMCLGMLCAVSARAQTEEDEKQIIEFWTAHSTELENAGISRRLYRGYHYWVTGQYFLGMCEPYISARDVHEWRTLWDKPPFDNSDFGRMLLVAGAKVYESGVDDRLKAPISRSQCDNVVADWVQEMLRISADEK